MERTYLLTGKWNKGEGRLLMLSNLVGLFLDFYLSLLFTVWDSSLNMIYANDLTHVSEIPAKYRTAKDSR